MAGLGCPTAKPVPQARYRERSFYIEGECVNFRERIVRIAQRNLSPATKHRIRRARRGLLRRLGSERPTSLSRARMAFQAGDYETAAPLLAESLERQPGEIEALRLASRVAMRRGEVTDAATFAMMRHQQLQKPKDWLSARQLAGRLRETDPRWQPIVSGPPPSNPAGEGILYLAKESSPFLHNGFCTRTHESLRALAHAGWKVRAVTMPGFPAVIGVSDPPSESIVEGIRYQHLLPCGAELAGNLAFDEYVSLATQVLAGRVARQRPGLLHVGSGHRGFETALVGNAVARWANIPWIYEVRSFFETTWTADLRYREQGEYYERRFATETRMMHAADMVITLSGPMREEIVNQHGVPVGKIRVVPNAVDLERFRPRERDQSLREQLGLSNRFTLGYVSNLSHPREGQEILIDAVARLRKQGYAAAGLLVGDGSRRTELELLARQLGVGADVIFTGNVPFHMVADYYAQIDLFVVPRIDERAARLVSPMKPFEAMAMKVPVLVADLPALTEIAGSGARARTFRAGDSQSLAHEATVLIDTPAEMARLVSAASQWVQQERSWAAVATAFGKVYDDLLGTIGVGAQKEA